MTLSNLKRERDQNWYKLNRLDFEHNRDFFLYIIQYIKGPWPKELVSVFRYKKCWVFRWLELPNPVARRPHAAQHMYLCISALYNTPLRQFCACEPHEL
jgi:hypothetical protein